MENSDKMDSFFKDIDYQSSLKGKQITLIIFVNLIDLVS